MLSWQRAGDALFCPGSNEAIADRTDNQKLKPATYGGQGQAADSKQVTIRVAKGFSYLLPLSGGQGQNDLQKGEIMATESELLLKAAGVTSAVTIALIEEFEDDRIRAAVYYNVVKHSYGPGGIVRALRQEWDIWPHEGDRDKVIELLSEG